MTAGAAEPLRTGGVETNGPSGAANAARPCNGHGLDPRTTLTIALPHTPAAGVTGGDEGGNDRLVIRLPISLVNVETIHSPDGWLQLLSAEPGETLAAFWDRAIVRNPFLQSIIARTSRQPVPSGAVACPAALTLAWWEKTWPDKMFSPYFVTGAKPTGALFSECVSGSGLGIW